jgi:hypothetical protein
VIDDFEETLVRAWAETVSDGDEAEGWIRRLQRTQELLRRHPPPAQPGGHLLVVARDAPVYWFRLQETTVIGRKEGDLVLEHPWISARHCVVSFDGEDWWLDCPETTNRTRVNGAERSRHLLHDGDAIDLGAYMLVFARIDAPA